MIRLLKDWGIVFLGCVFVLLSLCFDLPLGKEMAKEGLNFLSTLMQVVPCVFILIGLFNVWVKREVVERHLGEDSGLKGYFWAVVLAGTTVGGLFVAFPIAVALAKKGASLRVIFAYVGAAGVCRLPMTLFEATFVGWHFTLLRYSVALPLILITGSMLGQFLAKEGYTIKG